MQNWGLGASWDLFWRLWGPCGCPGGSQCSKITKKWLRLPSVWDPILDHVWYFFAIWDTFRSAFSGSLFGLGFGLIFEWFLEWIWGFFGVLCLDFLWPRVEMKKVVSIHYLLCLQHIAMLENLWKIWKNVVRIGDALWDCPGHAFELHFEVFWGPFGRPWDVTLGKKGVQKGFQKMMQKTGLRRIPTRGLARP